MVAIQNTFSKIEINKVPSKKHIDHEFISVDDCDLPLCPTNIICAKDSVQCTRICKNDGFGDNNCPTELKTKKGNCPAVDCGRI